MVAEWSAGMAQMQQSPMQWKGEPEPPCSWWGDEEWELDAGAGWQCAMTTAVPEPVSADESGMSHAIADIETTSSPESAPPTDLYHQHRRIRAN